MRTTILLLSGMLVGTLALAGDTRIVCSFENPDEVQGIKATGASVRRVAEHATEGQYALEVQSQSAKRLQVEIPIREGNWQGYGSLALDATNTSDEPVLFTVEVRDQAGAATVAKGLWRVRVQQVVDDKQYIRVRFGRAGSDETPSGASGLMKDVLAQIDEFVKLMPGIPPEIIAFLKSVETPGRLADTCAYSPFFTLSEKLELLRTLDPEERLAKVNRLFGRQLADMKKVAGKPTIEECETCMDLADRAFDMGLNRSGDIAKEFLDHVVKEHPDELMVLLAGRYGPMFLRRRALK